MRWSEIRTVVLPGIFARDISRFLLMTAVIAAIYVATAMLSMLLVLAPLQLPAIFFATGVAVAAVFIYGRAALAGIFAGALIYNLGAGFHNLMLTSAQNLVAMPFVTLISTAQAGVAGWWLRRRLGYPCGFDHAREIGIFLVSTPFFCMIGGTLSPAVLWAANVVNSQQIGTFWLMWWLAETMGVLIVLPIVMVLAGEPRELWRKRKIIVIAPMVVATAFFGAIYIQVLRWEELESLNYLRSQMGWQSWTVLMLGLFGTGLLGAFLMLSSGHTARVEAEVARVVRALRESEARWQFALEGAGDGIWDIDTQTDQMFLSAKSMSILGYEAKAKTISTSVWRTFIHPDDLVRGEALFGALLQSGSDNYIFNFRALAHDGRWHWIRRRGKLIGKLPNGLPERIIGTHTDIDAEQHREHQDRLHGVVMEMLAHGKKFSAILEAIVTGLHNADTDIVYAIFIAEQNQLVMATSGHFSAPLRDKKIPLDKNPQSGGSAVHEKKIVHVPMSAAGFEQHLLALANDAHYALCWTEFLQEKSGEVSAALVAFRSSRERESLPALDDIKRAVDLMETAMQHKLVDEQTKLILSVFEASSEGIIIFSADGRVLAANPAFTRITGYALEDVVGRNRNIFEYSWQNTAAYEQLLRTLGTTGYWKGEISATRKNGEIFPMEATVDTIRDESGEVTRRICVFSDITVKKIAEERIQYLATHDALTALPNRGLFYDRLRQALALAQRENDQLALLFIDLDHFKPVNDTLGHAVGDSLLQAVAKRMSANVRESDTVARLGGDEFVVLLPIIKSADDCFAVGDKILRALNEPFDIEKHTVHISASIGVAIYPHDGNDENELAQHADKAMYRVKRQGRNAIEK